MLALDCDAVSQNNIVPDVAQSFTERKSFSEQPTYMRLVQRKARATSSSQTAMDSTIDLMTAPRWMDAANDKIRKLSALEDNWDGYGSPRISDRAKKTSLQILSFVKTSTPPIIGPSPKGGLQLTFMNPIGELEFHVDANGNVEYLLECVRGASEGAILATDGTRIMSLSTHLAR